MDDPTNLMSDTKLAAILIMLGVQPPMKFSAKQKKEVYAFAKTDKEFTDLLEHENETVQALVAARLGHKSTLEETRSKRLLDMSRYVDLAPVPLKYSGAHTHRFSGDWKINLQNLGNDSKLRKALRAPKGKLVVSVDASQIEARINAEVSGETWLIDAFRQGRDVYAEFAQDVFGHPINKKDHPNERFVGKTGILSLGYGSSALVFMNMIRNKSTSGFQINEAFAIMTVNMYRSKCARIVEHWRQADREIIPKIAQGVPVSWGALEIGLHTITLPNGNKLHYDNLRHAYSSGDDRFGWLYDRAPRENIKLYGAKVVENECQSLAFVHISEVAMRVWQMTDGLLWPAHQVHDELIYVVDEHLAEQVAALVESEMSKSPDWMPNIPLAAESHIGETYGDT
jgi:DNA polymerase